MNQLKIKEIIARAIHRDRDIATDLIRMNTRNSLEQRCFDRRSHSMCNVLRTNEKRVRNCRTCAELLNRHAFSPRSPRPGILPSLMILISPAPSPSRSSSLEMPAEAFERRKIRSKKQQEQQFIDSERQILSERKMKFLNRNDVHWTVDRVNALTKMHRRSKFR